jgi:hypothetical protein
MAQIKGYIYPYLSRIRPESVPDLSQICHPERIAKDLTKRLNRQGRILDLS